MLSENQCQRSGLIPDHIAAGIVVLRPAGAEDMGWLEELWRDEVVMEYLGREFDYSCPDACRENEHQEAMHFIVYGETGTRVGYIGAYPDGDCYPAMPRWYIHFAISPSCRCQGYATAAVDALTLYLMKTFAYPRVVADVSANNAPAQRTLEKCGYVRPEPRFAYMDYARVKQGCRFQWYRLQPGMRAECAVSGKQLYDLGRYSEAIAELHRGMGYRHDPMTPYTDLWMTVNLGMAYSSAGLYLQARRLLERAEVMAEIEGVDFSFVLRELAWIERKVSF